MNFYIGITIVAFCADLTEAIEYSNDSVGYWSKQVVESNRDNDAENRQKPCLEYGMKCLREGENDRCCLREGGMCKTNPKTQQRVCTRKKKDTPWELLLIDKLLNVGFSGGAAWVKENGEIKGKKGSGNFVTENDIKRSFDFYTEAGVKHCTTPDSVGLSYGFFKYECRGYRVLKEGGNLLSAWLQGETSDFNHGVIMITTLKYAIFGFHETKELGLSFAYHHMEMLYDVLAELEEKGGL